MRWHPPCFCGTCVAPFFWFFLFIYYELRFVLSITNASVTANSCFCVMWPCAENNTSAMNRCYRTKNGGNNKGNFKFPLLLYLQKFCALLYLLNVTKRYFSNTIKNKYNKQANLNSHTTSHVQNLRAALAQCDHALIIQLWTSNSPNAIVIVRCYRSIPNNVNKYRERNTPTPAADLRIYNNYNLIINKNDRSTIQPAISHTCAT